MFVVLISGYVGDLGDPGDPGDLGDPAVRLLHMPYFVCGVDLMPDRSLQHV